MPLRILRSPDGNVMYDSVTNWAFGPVFPSYTNDIEEFIAWLPDDARSYDSIHLERLHSEWAAERAL